MRLANTTISAEISRAAGLAKRNPMKSGKVIEPTRSVKTRRRGATRTHESELMPTAKTMIRSQGRP